MPSESSFQPALAEDWRNGGFGIYVHWPFCAAKCPYCDFNSHVSRNIDQDRWAKAYLREFERLSEELAGREVGSIFFGGGTPSLMDPALVDTILTAISRHWPLSPDVEVTLEANPTSVEAGKFRAFRSAGVNRLSMGVQALNDRDLKALGRMHTASEALAAFNIARETFSRISFDLIYARQGQTPEAWRAELLQAIDIAVDHLSLYQLTIEPNTRFGELAALDRLRGLPDDDSAADMYLMTQETLEQNGLPAYEISNHARPGAECRHNLVYWRYGDYVGVGPGAHGRLSLRGTRQSTVSASNPETWLKRVAETGSGELEREILSPQNQAEEMVMMGLRLAGGIDCRRYAILAGQELNPTVIAELESADFARMEDGMLKLTAKGRPLANAIIKSLLIQ